MKLTAISDTHGLYEDLDLGGGDVLIHAGDSCRHSTPSTETHFMEWMRNQPYAHKIFIPGNHDFMYADLGCLMYMRELFPQVNILLDSGVTINGINFYGVPWTLPFYDWAFMKNEYQLEEVFAKVPDNTDVLITHGPSFNILDECYHGGHLAGSKTQSKRINELLNLKYHIFGHIHETYGMVKLGKVTHLNASVLNLRYNLENAPHDFTIGE